ncbi:MAG TPA: hypothetical protein VHA11_04000 [Bryobacteraceae bacterium]|nr:hypothetical protein [Bryobacteraceae bacterium]
MHRRTFLMQAAGAALAPGLPSVLLASPAAAIDFRYAPRQWQTAFCFPDDPFKSLVGNRGQLLYGHPGRRNIEYFPTMIEFSLAGMQRDHVARQELEAPGVPVVHTQIERPDGFLELTTFATNRAGEGRVDNVCAVVRPRSRVPLDVVPRITVRTREALKVQSSDGISLAFLGGRLLLAMNRPVSLQDTGSSWVLSLGEGSALPDQPLEFCIRFPQEAQDAARISSGLSNPAALLEEARAWWRGWRAFEGDVDWKLPGVYGRFLTACARNIQQAREVRNGKLTFQVGPTVYRGLWVVDGNFILEAARYLGFDAEASQGTEATWSYQKPSGAVQAGAGEEHWKDTAIAMFTLVRQCELMQDWTALERLRPNVLQGVGYLKQIRERAVKEGGPAGRYGLLARGFGDGGLSLGYEFTNTLWVLAGLKAVASAAREHRLAGFEPAERLYSELRPAFEAAARQEMARHPAGFEYLPMLMKDDPLWNAPDPRLRPRPQTGQWALSHAIYPGILFSPEDPVVKGHIALMQACTQEDVPVETGWLPFEGLWTYNAPFVSHVYLWAGLQDWARLTFHGFLNHASPLYCWREEQPLQNSLRAGYVGDMPHNWASAECILYLRHMLALEDGRALRLLEGIGDPELALGEPFEIKGSPTRFGRIALSLHPDGRSQWRLDFRRGRGETPAAVQLPAQLGSRFRLSSVSGAEFKPEGRRVRVSPRAAAWSAVWSS